MSDVASREDATPPTVMVTPQPAPVRAINPEVLKSLGTSLGKRFDVYASDRIVIEQKWMRNLRQYLGIYDPEIERQLQKNRSQAYPRITRVKCVSMLARIMNLMFPANERHWELKPSPAPDLPPEDVAEAVHRMAKLNQEAGTEFEMDDDFINLAVQRLAAERAKALITTMDDQLQELGGDQTLDHIALNRAVIKSAILYGVGLLRGPFVREQRSFKWEGGDAGKPVRSEKTSYKPMFEFLPVWDFYPDMAAKTLNQMDGYFVRLVMTRSQVRKLKDRTDFFPNMIEDVMKRLSSGNYKARNFDTELRSMGVRSNVDENKSEEGGGKFEVIIWHGPISGKQLQAAGATVPDGKLNDDIDAEVWLIDGTPIKCDINPWRKMGTDVKMLHAFQFDEDDTSPIGNGLPNIMRDSQMSVNAATRMLMDNASIACGTNIEVNLDLLLPQQDISGLYAHKTWYREGMGNEANIPAVRNIQIDAHMQELLKVIELFMQFADAETFVGPQTGGDTQQGPSEPMRTAAGQSMMRADAALPFKDIIRNFDSFTQSVIYALVQFNRKFNANLVKEGDFNVIARGATSMIAKEVRGMQIDALSVTLKPNEMMHVDDRKMIEARFAVRDLQDMLVSEDEAKRRAQAESQRAQQQMEQATALAEAERRKVLAESFKDISQAQKNMAAADATNVTAALAVLDKANGEGADDGAK